MHDAVKAFLVIGVFAGSVIGYQYYNVQQERSTAVARDKRTTAEHAYKARLTAPPKSRILQVGSHQIVVVDLALESGLGPTSFGGQRCYVWRDAEFKTASLSCPHEESLEHVEE